MITTYRQRLEAMVGPERISTTSVTWLASRLPELLDASENSSACCWGGSNWPPNNARTHLVTSGRLATIPLRRHKRTG